MESRVEIKLESPVEISKEGEFVDTVKAELVAPSGKHRKDVSKVQTALGSILLRMSALDNKGSSKEASGDHEMTAADIAGILMFAGEDIDRLDDAVCKLLTSGGCILDGTFRLNSNVLDEAPVTVYHQLRAEYIANFLASSLGGTGGKKG